MQYSLFGRKNSSYPVAQLIRVTEIPIFESAKKVIGPHQVVRVFVTEMALGTVLGSLLPAMTMYLTMSGFPMAVVGRDGFLSFLARNAIGMGTVMTLLMTFGLRSRLRRGTLSPMLGSVAAKLSSVLPTNVIARSLTLGALALVGPGVLVIGLVWSSGVAAVDRETFAVIIAGEGALIASCLIPVILLAALGRPHPA